MRASSGSFGRLRARPRLLASVALALALVPLLPDAWSPSARALVAWDVGTLVYLLLVFAMFAGVGNSWRATDRAEEDEGALAILVLTVFAAIASLAGAVIELATRTVEPAWPHLLLVASTLGLSWAFVHTMFALHYSRLYRLGRAASPDAPREAGGGLDFQSDEEPDDWDFVYFAFVIGSTAQTADVTIKSRRIRRVATAHGVVSFVFNTTVLALGITVIASLL